MQLFRDESINVLLQSEVELCTRVGLSSLVVSVEHVHSTVRHETLLYKPFDVYGKRLFQGETCKLVSKCDLLWKTLIPPR